MLQGLGVKDELLFSAYLKMVHYFGSQYENRIRYAKKALAMQPENSKALRHLAWAYWLKGDWDNALSIYAKLERVDPTAADDVFQMRPEIKKVFEDNQMTQEIA
jgi:tetratricopeptide (TPR) repeat protein